MSKSRRGRGEGTIIQRPGGGWYAQVSAGTDRKGKRKRITVVGDTKTEVRDKIAKKVASRAEGTLISPDTVTVEGFLARWLAAISGSVKGATYDSYSRYIRTHINPAIGHVKLQRLDMLHVETMLSGMMRSNPHKEVHELSAKRQKYRGLQPPQAASNRTKQYARAILSKALDHAVLGNLIPRNVANLVPAPSAKRVKEMVILEETAVNKMLAGLDGERYGRVYGLSVLTGMREGEYLALQWDDIDLKATPPVLRVRRTQSYEGGRVILVDPKTASGKRTITLTPDAVEILQDQKREMLREGHISKKFVFVDEAGEMLIRSGPVRSCLNRLIRKLDLPKLSAHDLRHTHATLLLRAGVNPKVASERLGHADVRITLQIYSHVLPSSQADVITKLNKLLG